MNNSPSTPQGNLTGYAARVRNRLKYSPRMLPDLFWTLTANAIASGSGIVVFKIISRWIPAQEYGQASLVLGVAGLLHQLLIGPVVVAHMRLYFGSAAEGRGDEYSRVLLQLLFRNAAILSLIYLAIGAIYYSLGDHVYIALALPAVLLIVSQSQLTGTMAVLEVEKRYRTITLAQSLSKALQVPFLIIMIWLAMGGPAAVISSQVAAGLFVALVWSAKYLKPQASTGGVELSARSIAASAAKTFGWTLYLFNLFGWILATSDRYFIEHYWSAREVGIYALNYGLWSVPFMALNAWLEVTVRSRIYERFEAKDGPGAFRLVRYRIALAIASGAALLAVVYFIGPWIAHLVLGDKYWYGSELMMLISTAHFAFIIAATLHGVFQGLKQTDVLVKISLIAAVVNVVLNLVLVPRMGILGAAWSTLAAYAVMCITTFLFGWRVLRSLRTQSSVNENA